MNRNQQRQGSGPGNHVGNQSQWRGSTQQCAQGQNRQQPQQGGTRHDGRQSMQQGGDAPQFGGRQFESMAEVALRGTALLWDLQMETARNVFRTQARTAAMFGVPDCSEMFEIGDARARRLFSMGAEQVLNTARQARETVAEMQRQFGRIAEKQTIGMTEQVRDQIEQIGRHTEQGLQEIRDIARAEAEQAEGLAQQSLDYGDEGRFSAQNGESAQRGEELGEGSQPMQAEANGAWEPRFDDASDAANGARENAGEADDQWKRTRRTKGGPRANRARVHVVSA